MYYLRHVLDVFDDVHARGNILHDVWNGQVNVPNDDDNDGHNVNHRP